jgi:hypothetical protein
MTPLQGERRRKVATISHHLLAITHSLFTLIHTLTFTLINLTHTHTPSLPPSTMSSAVRRDRRSYEATRRPRSPRPAPNSDFVEFVHRVLDICFYPYATPQRS